MCYKIFEDGVLKYKIYMCNKIHGKSNIVMVYMYYKIFDKYVIKDKMYVL